MSEYNWPGNIRELENLLERLVIIGQDSIITSGQIHQILSSDGKGAALRHEIDQHSLKELMESYERSLIQSALETHGSTYKAAEALGASQATIARKALSYGLKWK
ncbi:Transcriptional regulatory protein TyrR [bioreactor metagenome]|uniref:Transcriptional regulatory protein TyrR n=1 Tax=bioreactor metagenome TaxID=1076179 RepID=A0A645GSG1_9ZZZZ